MRRRRARAVFSPTVPAEIPAEISSSGRIYGDVYAYLPRAESRYIPNVYIAGKCADV